MLSVGQAVSYLSQKGTTKRFKPWWEYIIDYLIHSLFIIVLVSWRFVLQETSFGVACMAQPLTNITFWNTFYAKYFSEKCALEVYSGYLVRFPSLAFFQWILLYSCQMFWYSLPCVKTKLAALGKLLQECEKTKYTLQERRDSVYYKVQAYAKWKFIFEEHSSICKMYYLKCFAIVFFSSVAFSLFLPIANWFNLWGAQNIAYKATLADDSDQILLLLFCNLSSARLTFLLIVLNLVILLMLAGLSIFFLLYSLQKRSGISGELSKILLIPDAFSDFSPCFGTDRESAGWADVCLVFAFYDASVHNREKWREEVISLGANL